MREKKWLQAVPFVVLLLFAAEDSTAQKITIDNFELSENDLSASVHPHFDHNNTACALIKVHLSMAEAKFEGNVESSRFDNGEYWVYMTEGSYLLRIKQKDITPLSINFRDYGVSGVEPKKVYVLTLTLSNDAHTISVTPRKKTKEESAKALTLLSENLRKLNVDMVSGFVNGLCAVRKDGKWGFVDKEGKQKTAFDFDAVGGDYYLTDDYCKVQKNGKWGVVNENGILIVPCNYYSIRTAKKDTIIVEKSKGAKPAIITNGKLEKIRIRQDQVPYLDREHSRFYDSNENQMFNRTFDYAYPFSEGFACVKEKDGLWYVIDLNGGHVFQFPPEIRPSYNESVVTGFAGEFHEGLLPVVNVKTRKNGFIDINGQLCIPCQFDGIGNFSHGLAVVKSGNFFKGDEEFAYIDKFGEIALSGKKYFKCKAFNDKGWALVENRDIDDPKDLLIDKNGKELVQSWHDGLNRIWWGNEKFAYNLAPVPVRVNGKKMYGYVDKNLKTVVPFEYQYCGDFRDEFTVIIDKDDNFGFIDSYGNISLVGKRKD